VVQLAHPDLHWFIPIARPKASDPAKQVEEARDSLTAKIEERRANSIYGRPDGLDGHGVASARVILETAALTTVEGGRRVILIGEADRLVPQEANPEAANTLLKFLEEPSPANLIVLTTTDPTRVLPTIRSRSVPIRLGRLDPKEIEAGLAELVPSLSAAERRARAERAEGSLGRALAARDESAGRDAAAELLAAIKQGGVARHERALRQGPWQARGEFSTLLDRLAETLGNAARVAAGANGREPVPEPLAEVTDPARLIAGLDRVDHARELARGNVNPQLLLANLTRDLAEALWR
jgi:DNA polymerase-3 subunit delta'